VPPTGATSRGAPRATRGAVLVSEVMLQQTQVDRVIGYYEAFLDAFPRVGRLRPGPAR
jgi:adenine-specific DNA glycosylase